MYKNHKDLEDIISIIEKYPNDSELGRVIREKYYLFLRKKKNGRTIGLDFDGTCVTHEFPFIGKDIGAVPVLKKIVESGNNIVLFTMRSDGKSGDFLSQAIKWFEANEIPLCGIQKNPTQHQWTSSPKAFCEIYIDDAALGCPLKIDPSISNRPFVDWEKVESMLREMDVL
jgi:hypothetical protein